ncbi:MAG: lysophospholipid acyltransferase family protein [Dermatophilaceae bacterium]
MTPPEPGRPRPTAGATRVGATFRHWLWRGIWDLVGGLRVTGTPPTGPAILVANHQSHADTAALLASIPPTSRPVMAAAADYWFSNRLRRTTMATIVAALPVHRSAQGSYAALREAAAPVLRGGGIVVVFPEGTRSTDGIVGEFHPGAVRLADDLDVPLVPVALLGTAQVLPKNGHLHSGAGEVRFGTAFDSEGLAADPDTAHLASDRLREVVVAMREAGPVEPIVSPVWRRVARAVDSPAGLALAAGWGFAEALSWPVIAEMEIVLLAGAVPRRTPWHGVAVAAGSVAGVAAHVWLRRRGVRVPLPLTTPRMGEHAAGQVAAFGAGAFWRQLASGIPVKVYAAQAADSDLSMGRIVLGAGAARATRIVGLGLGFGLVARWLHPAGRHSWGRWMAVSGGQWALAVRWILRIWS